MYCYFRGPQTLLSGLWPREGVLHRNFSAPSLALLPLLLLCRFFHALPRRAFALAGAGLGGLLYHLSFRRKIVAANLALAYGRELSAPALEQLARRFYASLGRTFLEIARNFALSAGEMRNELLLRPEDRARIEEALARGKGVVFVNGHIGNWELLAMGMAAHGFPAAIVVKKMSGALSQALIERQRRKTGLEIIYSGGAIEKMRAALAHGKVIGFMVDQNITGKRGIRCNYFGVPAASIRALGALVRDSGAAVIPICVFRQEDGRMRVHLEPELRYLEAPLESEPDRALREEWLNAQQYQAAVEAMVRLHPEQWLWIHRRWKASREPLAPETAHLENRETAT